MGEKGSLDLSDPACFSESFFQYQWTLLTNGTCKFPPYSRSSDNNV